MQFNMETSNIITETKVIEVPPTTTPVGQETFDDGYVEALKALMDVLNQPGGGGGGGGGGDDEQQFPDPRLVMPTKKSKGGAGDNDDSPKPKNKQMDVDTGEDVEDEPQGGGGEESEQEKADNSAESAQSAADAASKAAQEAQAQAEVDAKNASDSGDPVDQKKSSKSSKAAEKAQKAADKAQKAADKAKKAAERGDAKAAAEAEAEAKDAANEAKIANNEMKHASEVEGMSAEEAAADAANSAQEARDAAEAAKKAAEQYGDNPEDKLGKMAKKAAERAEKAANDAEKAAEAAQKAAESGDSSKALEKAQEAAQKAREAADVAKAAKNSAERANELDNNDDEGGEYHSQGTMSDRDKMADPEDLEGDLYDCRDYVKGVVEQFSKKLTGPLGEFLGKSREAIADIARIKNKEKRMNVKTYAKKAKKAWDVDFQHIIDAYVSECIQERKREMRATYARPNRRQGQVKDGDIVKKGRLPDKNKMDITMTFYIDISGSMSGSPVVNAFKAAYAYSDYIRDRHEDEAVVGDFEYTFYAFNTRFHKITDKKIPSANGDNVDFNEILEYIEQHSLNDMINVIITDAYFPIAVNKSCECIKRTEGLFIVIANNDRNVGDFEKMKDKLKDKFEFLQADHDFTFHLNK